MRRRVVALAVLATALAGSAQAAEEPIHIGSRLELMVDDYLIDRWEGKAELRLHRPTPREVVIVHDEPWEGSGSGYHTIFKDGELYRMYYKAWQLSPEEGKLVVPHPTFGCYAESTDGIHWTKPNLGLFEFSGSKENNIVWAGKGSHDFTPFKDPNPDCNPEERYKAVGSGGGVLLAFKSADGIHWAPLRKEPVITYGAFDSQNLAFWDRARGQYRAYFRGFREGRRDVLTATSEDFVHWTEPKWIQCPGAAKEHLYTNQVKPYYRAPHIFIGFPTRYVDRGWSKAMEALPELQKRKVRSSSTQRYGTALTEGLLMTSRDGVTFHRWPEAYLRPGLRPQDNWTYGDNYIAWHAVETKSAITGAPNELSIYATEGYFRGTKSWLRRYTLRVDGFVSVRAPMSGGEFVTRPLVFEGKQLVMNLSTSAAGSVRVEVQDTAGAPIDGFDLSDCPDLFGDSLEYAVEWTGEADVGRLAGKPVRLRFVLRDADLYSFRFR